MTWGFTDFFFFLLKSRNYSVRRIYYKNSYLRKNLLDFKYLLILLKSLDCLLFVLKLFFSCRCWKIHQYFIWHKKKNPLCNPPNPFSKLRDLNGSMPSVPLHFGSSDLTSVSYRTKCELVIGIQGSWQKSHVPCFNKNSLSYMVLQRCSLNTGVSNMLVHFWWLIWSM